MLKIKFWKFLVQILRAQENARFLFFIFFSLWLLSNCFCQISYEKKSPVFITNIKSSHNFLHFYRDLRSRNFWQWNESPLKIFWKLHENAFSLHISAKFRKFETCIDIEMRNFGLVLAVIAKIKFSKLLNLI